HPKAVLGARATKFPEQPWGEVTVNEKNLFLHITNWPENGEIILSGLATKVGKVHEDNSTDELDWEYSKNKLTIKLPQEPMDHIVPVIRVEMLDNLLIIPEKTVVENTDGNWLIKEKDLYTGCSYADQGHYFSLTQTTVRQSAF